MPASCAIVIPARIGSGRMPRKMLRAETGRPLVQHAADRAIEADVGPVIVATDSHEIADALAPFGTTIVLTDPTHPSGTDRVAEVAAGRDEAIYINVQGDEPEIDPALIRRLADHMAGGDDPMATAAVPLPADLADDPNRVKVVLAEDGRALYFSRSRIPFDRDEPPQDCLLHVGVYAYRRDLLLAYPSLPQTAAERREKLEQLRALGHGRRVAVLPADAHAAGIDTEDQYRAFVQRHRQRNQP